MVLKALEAAVQTIKDTEPSPVAERSSNASNDASEVNEKAPAGALCEEALQHQREYQHRQADALVLMANQSLQSTSINANTADRYQVVVHVDSQILSGEALNKSTGEPDCYIEKEVGLPVEAVRRLSCDCKIVTAETDGSEPLNIGRSSRAIPVGIRRALTIRDGQCQFPGCDCHKHLDAHHIVHWSNGGETSMENLLEVCHYHHVKLHEGGYSVKRLSTGELQFYKPDGSILSGEPEPMQSSDPLRPCTAEAWSWSGDSMDYSIATHCIAYPKGMRSATGTDVQNSNNPVCRQ